MGKGDLDSPHRVETKGPSGRVFRFDAGWMGCDRLPMEFRRQIQSIGVGDIVEFVVFDPSAKEDLPALARLMGHKIRSTDELEDGSIRVAVERGR